MQTSILLIFLLATEHATRAQLVFNPRPTLNPDNSLAGMQLSCSNNNCVISDTRSDRNRCENSCRIDTQCVAFAFHPAASGNNCILYSQTFGFGGVTLISSGGRHNFHERQLDNLTDAMLQNYAGVPEADVFKTYLSRYRQGITGRWLGKNVTHTNVKTAEECAGLCTRWRGQIDPVTGDRCNSFNYDATNEVCELGILFEAGKWYARISRGLGGNSDFDITSGASNWRYYERIAIPGCWISQSECRMVSKYHPSNRSFIGTFKRPGVQYEWECASLARFFHEDVCDNSVHVPTITFWGGNDSTRAVTAVYEDWNSFDLTQGCVITLPSGKNCSSRLDRFSGTFRDSLGEEDRGASLVGQHCFGRARLWHGVCALAPLEPVVALHAASGRTFSFPLSECACDGIGLKIDPTTQRRYCTRANPTQPCSRSLTDLAAYDYPDILCDDITNPSLGCVAHPSNMTCLLIPPITCVGGSVPNNANYYDITANVPSVTTKTECVAQAQVLYDSCGGLDNLYVLWMPDSTVSTVPGFANPSRETTVRAMTATAAWTPDAVDPFGNPRILYLNLTSGRSMRFRAGNTGRVRHVDVWYRTESMGDVFNLTLELFDGTDINGVLLASGWGIAGPNATNGQFVHFSLDSGSNVDTGILRGGQYTWQISKRSAIAQVTAVGGNGSPSGYVGFTSGNGYVFGSSDFSDSIDYPFVVWYEFYQYSARPGALIIQTATETPFLGIWFIVLLCVYVIFAIVLCVLHRRRVREEEAERAQNKQMRERSEMSILDSSTKDFSHHSEGPREAEDMAGTGTGTGAPLLRGMHQVPSVAPSEEPSEDEAFVPTAGKNDNADKQRAYV